MKDTVIAFARARLAATDDKSKNIFSDEEMDAFASMALTQFNAVPPFSNFSFEEVEDKLKDVVVSAVTQLVVIYALASKALTERGREFQIQDNGVDWNPPVISDLLMNQYLRETDAFYSLIREVKSAIQQELLYNSAPSSSG